MVFFEGPGEFQSEGVSELSNPLYRNLYSYKLKFAAWSWYRPWPVYGDENDLDNLYPPELTSVLEEFKSLKELIEPINTKPSRTARAKNLALSNRLDELKRLLTLHNRRARADHLALARCLGLGWDKWLIFLGESLAFWEETCDTLSYLLSIFNLGDLRGLKVKNLKLDFISFLAHPYLYSSLGELLSPDKSSQPAKSLEKLNLKVLKELSLKLISPLNQLRNEALGQLIKGERLLRSQSSPQILSAPAPLKELTEPLLKSNCLSYGRHDPDGREKQKSSRFRFMASLILGATAAIMVYWLYHNPPAPPKNLLHAFNGLEIPISVEFSGLTKAIEPQRSQVFPFNSRSIKRLTARTKQGLIEMVVDFPSLREGEKLAYNAAGASPLIEWKAIYASAPSLDPPEEKRLGAPKIIMTKADFIFTDPPQTIKFMGDERTRLVLTALTNLDPEIMTQLAGKDATSLIEARARFGPPDSVSTAQWLKLLFDFSLKPFEILEARLKDYPLCVPSIESYLNHSSDEKRAQRCEIIKELTTQLSPGPREKYLASLCSQYQEELEADEIIY
ncbi:MAG: hypothetical protein LBV23_04655 [Deltaproteobacteria bacterium]|jgi:hypothetical protein|nr:hypothetical protein [Deltaproteobacteria bacterium]